MREFVPMRRRGARASGAFLVLAATAGALLAAPALTIDWGVSGPPLRAAALTPRGEERTMALMLRSPAFEPGGEIPSVYTCEGRDISPPLAWQGIPAGTKSLALIVDDPDAPDPAAPKRVWVHWVLYNIPATATGLPEGVASQRLAAGTVVGKNDSNDVGYGGPCPPIGRHRYHFKLYALDAVLAPKGAIGKKELEPLMKGHILEQTELIGTYQKTQKR